MDEQSIFLKVLDKAPEERAAWLDGVCGTDIALRQRIEALLRSHHEASRFLERPAEVLDVTLADGAPGGRTIGTAGSHSGLETLRKSLNTPRVALRDANAEGDDPIVRSQSSEIPKWTFESRYQWHGEIGRGGMGAIIKGRDNDLGRDLVIKVLLDEHKDREEVIQRFVEEAQIGGQLQHPGIAPVYELGQFAEGRPYFTMKLVKGKTLSALLADSAGPEDRLKFLGIFEQVCQTIAYAHSRGVIHRDLKPANIMVGAFGEVQVMDWGLAKVLAQGGVADEIAETSSSDASVIRTFRSGAGDTPLAVGSQTHVGSVMGTPAYMAPEQAHGEVERLDERADVFGLGAILCQILTGAPPYTGESSQDVFWLARRADLNDCLERLSNCGADPELIALAKRCLAEKRGDRPRNAGELSAQVTAYLQSVELRLRQKELQIVAAEARAAEERKRRKIQLGLAASILCLVLLGGGGWSWIAQQQASRARELADQLNSVIRQAALLRERALSAAYRQDWSDASQKCQQAEALLGTLPESALRNARVEYVTSQLRGERQDYKLLADFEKARLQSEQIDFERRRWAVESALPVYQQALREWGATIARTNVRDAADRIRDRPDHVRSTILAGLDHWASVAPRHSGLTLRAVPDAIIVDRVVQGGAAAKDGRLKRRDRLIGVGQGDGEIVSIADKSLKVVSQLLEGPPGSTLRLQVVPFGNSETKEYGITREGSARDWLLEVIGRADPDPWRIRLREAATRQDTATLKQLADQQEAFEQRPATIVFLAETMHQLGETEAAVSMLRTAQRYHADDFWINYLLGRWLTQLDPPQHPAAIRYCSVAVSTRPKSSGAHHALATALSSADRPNEAIAEYRMAIQLQPQHPLANSGLVVALARLNRLGDALAECRRQVQRAPDVAWSHNNLGCSLRDKAVALQAQGDAASAAKYAAQAMTEFHRALARDQGYRWARTNRINMLFGRPETVERGIAECHQALALDPYEPEFYYLLGAAFESQGDIEAAMKQYERALGVDENHMRARIHLGVRLFHQGREDQGIAQLRDVIKQHSTESQAYFNLGSMLARTGELDEAVSATRKSIELDPAASLAYFNLAGMLERQGLFGEALEAAREGSRRYAGDARASETLQRLERRSAWAERVLGAALRERGELIEAVHRFRRSVHLDPSNREARAAWIDALNRLGRFQQAVDQCREAVELNSGDVDIFVLWAEALSHQNQLVEANTKLQKALELSPNHAGASIHLGVNLVTLGEKRHGVEVLQNAARHHASDSAVFFNLGWALLQQERWQESLEASRKSIQLQPFQDGAYNNLHVAVAKTHQFASTANFYADHLAKYPTVAERSATGTRYNGACFAALAGSGIGDGQQLPDVERQKLREVAIKWLRAELATLAQDVETKANSHESVRGTLSSWLEDSDLSGIRDPSGLEKLGALERDRFKRFWDDVEALKKRTLGKKS